MSKDVNIHVKATDADASKQKLDQVAQSAKNVGDKVSEAGKKGAADTKAATGELSGMSKILGSLKSQVVGFVGAWLGMQGVQKVVGGLIQKLERVAQLQKDIYQNSLNLAHIGQALEFQTGTTGRQQFWSTEAAKLAQAGGLADVSVAGQMMIAADIAFASQGGIKSDQVRSLLTSVAPFAGAAGMGPEDITKAFEFAGTAGIAPTPAAYQQYFAQLQAGYTASKSTSFGQFMIGLQKGATPYMATGGSLTEAISLFSGARAITSNEMLAGTLLEQISRLSSGAYAKPRAAIEAGLGVSWSDLSMDQRSAALLSYAQAIPESQRMQVLAEQGFPVELTSQLGKIVSPAGLGTIAATRGAVAGATPGLLDAQTRAYLGSDLAKQRQLDAQLQLMDIEQGPGFASWQRRLQESEGRLRILSATGEDRLLVPDSAERYLMAYESMLKDLEALEPYITDEQQKEKLADIQRGLKAHIFRIQEDPIAARFYGAGYGARVGHRYSQEMTGISGEAAVNYNFNNNTNYYPKIGADEKGPRYSQDE